MAGIVAHLRCIDRWLAALRVRLPAVLALGLMLFALSLSGGGSQLDTAEAQTSGTPWTLKIVIDVPFRDVDGDGTNDYNPTFELGVSRVSWDFSQGLAGACTHGNHLLPRIKREGEGAEITSEATEPGRAQGCVTRTEFEAETPSGIRGITLTRTSPQFRENSRTDQIARATYTDGRTTFRPNISLNGFTSAQAGQEFQVEYRKRTGSADACRMHPDQDHDNWRIDDNGIAIRTSQATLINVAAGEQFSCFYDVVWPDVPGILLPTDGRTVNVGSGPVTGTYRIPTGTPFTPQVTFNVPWTDYDENLRHDYAGVQLWMRFNPQAGSEGEGCSADGTEFRYEIIGQPAASSPGQPGNRTQLEVARGSPTTLIDRPTSSQHRCAYDVVFGGNEVSEDLHQVDNPLTIFQRLGRPRTKPSTDDETVSAESPTAEVTYEHKNQNIQVAFAVDAGAAADGASFTVRVSTSAPDRSHERYVACSTVTEFQGEIIAEAFNLTITVDETGAGQKKHIMTDWAFGHNSADDRCEYTLTWPDTEDGGTAYRRSGPKKTTLDASVFAQATSTNTPTMANTYTTSTLDFTPEVSVVVPDVDLLGDGVSEFAGERFRVRFAPGASSASDVNCTAASEAVYEVGSDGDVSLVGPFTSGSLADVAAGSLSLVGWHADSMNECDYVATFLASASLEQDHSDPLANDVNLSWSDPRVSVPFDTSRRSVDSVFQVTGLGVPEGTPVTVEYRLAASAPAGCVATPPTTFGAWTRMDRVWRSTLMVRSDNVKTLRNVTVWPKGWRTATDECIWTVSWPDQDDGQAYRKVPVPVGSQAEFEDGRLKDPPRFTLRYRAYYQRPTTYFTPSVAVSVPYEAAGGVNRYAGETITLRYARVSGASNECTASATETYVIGDGGTAATGGVTALMGAAARLVDEPEVTTGGTLSRACDYQVSAPDRSSTAGAAGQLGLIGGATIQFNADGLLPSGGALNFSYESVFVVDIDISVPDDSRDKLGEDGFENGDSLFKGTTFGVMIVKTSGPAAGCTAPDRTLLFVVDDQGVVNPDDVVSDADLVFVDRVPGAATPCAYTVTFPSTVGPASTTEAIDYVLTGGGTATISASNRRATASYTLSEGSLLHRRFEPDIDITVPGAGTAGNQYEGGQFEVTFTRQSGPATDCADQTLTYVVTSNGNTIISDSATAGAPFLVNRLTSSDAPCVYTATFPQNIQSPTGVNPSWTLHLQETTTDLVSFAGGEITRTYATNPPSSGGGDGGDGGDPADPSNGDPPNNGGDQPNNGGDQPNTPGDTNPGGNTGNTNTGNTNTGNTPTSRPRNTGGGSRGGGGGGSSRSSGGGGGGGAATGPWVVAATSRVPVSVSLAVPSDASIPAGAAVEIMLNVPETCGDDVAAFGGMAASIGLVYAIAAQPGATADVLAASALQLANHATRGDQTRGCELRVTLITAPDGCTLEGADTDEAGRPYVDLDADENTDRYSLTPSLVCS